MIEEKSNHGSQILPKLKGKHDGPVLKDRINLQHERLEQVLRDKAANKEIR